MSVIKLLAERAESVAALEALDREILAEVRDLQSDLASARLAIVALVDEATRLRGYLTKHERLVGLEWQEWVKCGGCNYTGCDECEGRGGREVTMGPCCRCATDRAWSEMTETDEGMHCGCTDCQETP